MAKTGNTLVALVAGAAIGAVAGLLYAPESGDKTRKKLTKKAQKAQADIEATTRQRYDQISSKASEFKGTVSERIEDALSTASYAADDAIVALENKLEQLRAKNAKLQKPSSVNGAVKTAAAKTKA